MKINEANYLIVLQEVSELIDLDPTPDSPEGERLNLLGVLIQEYERDNIWCGSISGNTQSS